MKSLKTTCLLETFGSLNKDEQILFLKRAMKEAKVLLPIIQTKTEVIEERIILELFEIYKLWKKKVSQTKMYYVVL